MKYKCPRCDYEFVTLQSITRHINDVKKICKNVNDIIPTLENIIKVDNTMCEYCDRTFTDKYSLTRHLVSCRALKEKQEQEKQEQETNIILRMKQLEEEVRLLKEKEKEQQIITNNINNGTTNTNNGVINNNIILNYNDDENSSFLTDKKYSEYSKNCLLRVPKIIQDVHFDPNRPENHNMYISNIKSIYAHKFNEGKWHTVNKSDFLDKVVEKYEIKVDGWENDPEMKKKYPEIEDNNIKYLKIIEGKGAKEQVKQDVELLMYNNKDMIIETAKKHGFK